MQLILPKVAGRDRFGLRLGPIRFVEPDREKRHISEASPDGELAPFASPSDTFGAKEVTGDFQEGGGS